MVWRLVPLGGNDDISSQVPSQASCLKFVGRGRSSLSISVTKWQFKPSGIAALWGFCASGRKAPQRTRFRRNKAGLRQIDRKIK
jgi:hypothetical protein